MEVVKWNWSKNRHYSNFFLQAIQTRKMSFTIFQNEKTPIQAIKTTTSKSRKIHIFPKVFPWFWSKNDHFSNFSFQVIEAWKMSFTIFQNKKKSLFRPKKTRSSKSRKIGIFPNIIHGFGPKMAIFPTFFMQYKPKKCLL